MTPKAPFKYAPEWVEAAEAQPLGPNVSFILGPVLPTEDGENWWGAVGWHYVAEDGTEYGNIVHLDEGTATNPSDVGMFVNIVKRNAAQSIGHLLAAIPE